METPIPTETAPFPGFQADKREHALTAELIGQIDEYIETLPPSPSDDAEAKQQQLSEATTFLTGNNLDMTILRNDEDPEAMDALFGALNRLEARLDDSLFDRFISVSDERILKLYQELLKNQSPGFTGLLDRMADKFGSGNTVFQLKRLEKIAGPQYGGTLTWRESGQPKTDLPVFLHKLAASENFPAACVDLKSDQLSQMNAEWQKRQEARFFEAEFLENVVGVSHALRKDLREATAIRVMKRDVNGAVIPDSEGGGLDDQAWRKTFKKYAEHFAFLGPEMVQTLRDDFHLVNIDVLRKDQLDHMRRIVQRDPATLEKLQKGDPVLALGDAYDNLWDEALLEDPGGMMVFGEVGDAGHGGDPLAIFSPWKTLVEKYGIVPSSVLFDAHGILTGGVTFSGKGMRIRMGMPTAQQMPLIRTHIDIRDLAPFTRDYLKPHTKTGKRYVNVASCHQFVTAEALARATAPEDKVVVGGPDTSAGLQRDYKGLYYQSHARGREKNHTYFWDDAGTTLMHSEEEYLLGVG